MSAKNKLRNYQINNEPSERRASATNSKTKFKVLKCRRFRRRPRFGDQRERRQKREKESTFIRCLAAKPGGHDRGEE